MSFMSAGVASYSGCVCVLVEKSICTHNIIIHKGSLQNHDLDLVTQMNETNEYDWWMHDHFLPVFSPSFGWPRSQTMSPPLPWSGPATRSTFSVVQVVTMASIIIMISFSGTTASSRVPLSLSSLVSHLVFNPWNCNHIQCNVTDCTWNAISPFMWAPIWVMWPVSWGAWAPVVINRFRDCLHLGVIFNSGTEIKQ